jgi:DNA adenine methylase
MQYLGGKHRLAKHLVKAIRADVGNVPVWDAFCGGLSMATEFSKTGPGVASDVHPALIALYQAVRAGWTPPEHVTEAMWREAKMLPDSDPMKGFAGFGCSFGGMYFGGYAKHNPGKLEHIYTKRALQRQLAALASWPIVRLSFFDVTPGPINGIIYCDPPYAGTTGYSTGDFDHASFWARCQEWAQYTAVYVSEFSCPTPHRVVLEIPRRIAVSGTSEVTKVDTLYQVCKV